MRHFDKVVDGARGDMKGASKRRRYVCFCVAIYSSPSTPHVSTPFKKQMVGFVLGIRVLLRGGTQPALPRVLSVRRFRRREKVWTTRGIKATTKNKCNDILKIKQSVIYGRGIAWHVK
jgi:hypothetical protein